ncbi:MAG: phosphopantetheine-binding protein [Thermodesulfobacteriota bacterium]|nr:phosphopantetheine-binding protein [Thermodesulfobacteriota bacterium]
MVKVTRPDHAHLHHWRILIYQGMFTPILLANYYGIIMDDLQQELLKLIMGICRIPAPVPADFTPDSPLFGPDSPLGTDSLDAVEIVVELQKKYNVRIDSEETSRKIFASLNILADFIRKQRDVLK